MKTKEMALISTFAVLTAVTARITIPLPVIPFTMQPTMWTLSGLLLGSRLGPASQLLYIVMGLIGIPVFVGGGGPEYIFSPTFGYLIGSVACSWLAGRIVEKWRSEGIRITRAKNYFAGLAGLLVAYCFAVLYLYALKNFWMPGEGMTFFRVVTVGFLTTIGPDLLKLLIVAIVAERLQASLPHLFNSPAMQRAN
ncbi:biotin transporter BioY [Synergistaceae bacterium OttesenSCG-928-D05]|nr:biotin transporter BioY [Synergistaceae bacterium OttesenSCG-928-D05]